MGNGRYLKMFDVARALERQGWEEIRRTGDHCIWKNGAVTLSIPLRTKNAYLIKSVLRRYNVEF